MALEWKLIGVRLTNDGRVELLFWCREFLVDDGLFKVRVSSDDLAVWARRIGHVMPVKVGG